MRAFVDKTSHVLTAWGYVATNLPTDDAIDVPESFNLEPGKHWYDNGVWRPYVAPLTQEQIDTQAARTDTAIQALKAMTPAQAKTWVANNVNTLADAKQLLGTLASAMCLLARRL